eukprot:11213992-Lingulodinium_polyedra.AAC.1
MSGPPSSTGQHPLPDHSIEEAAARIARLSTCEDGAVCRLPGAADVATVASAHFTCDGIKLDVVPPQGP